MNKTILIDAAQPGEVRVAVVKNRRIDDFDIEADDRKPLRGNIYLAKVMRVEPSLQAAFVEYGGNRQGFLAFDEIHPDYYQIPQQDRDALQSEVAEAMRNEAMHNEESAPEEESVPEGDHAGGDHTEGDQSAGDRTDMAGHSGNGGENNENGENSAEIDEAREAEKRLRMKLARRYNIQEVIKTRQVILVQVVKEERGAKGAALTTYLSLAGRFCVFMPNSMRGGGVSRKITSIADRKRLKQIIAGFDIPAGMGLIVRTAGARQAMAGISDDYEYLMHLWDNIRGKTMESVAPCLVHEESDMILRTVRDLHDNEVEAIYVSGEQTHQRVCAFFEQMMPDQKNKIHYNDSGIPLFAVHGVESQLDAVFAPQVALPSGGYLVIHQTEALVAIDVNSGKATRERNIETTALRTNEEAVTEAARQMRLRDLAGLIVIDFIDMEEMRNIRRIEKLMKDALDKDKARTQMGKISRFGLMEISRQRRRAGVMEVSSEPCIACSGTGRVRSPASMALKILRLLPERLANSGAASAQIEAKAEIILHLANEKRAELSATETDCGIAIEVQIDNRLGPDEFRLYKVSDKGKRTELSMTGKRPAVPTPKPSADKSEATPEASNETRRSRGSRRRKSRKRIPDMAIDGGELLEAIASAPFLDPASELATNGAVVNGGASDAHVGASAAPDAKAVAHAGASAAPDAKTLAHPVESAVLDIEAEIKMPTPATERRKSWWGRKLLP